MTKYLTIEDLARRLGMSVTSTLDLCHASGVSARSANSRVRPVYAEMIERRAIREGLVAQPASIGLPIDVAPRGEQPDPGTDRTDPREQSGEESAATPSGTLTAGCRFHPPLIEVDRFATPLNAGERRVLQLFAERLDESWDVFVQPSFLSNQPDFLLVSIEGEVTVLEVKDWSPTIYLSTANRVHVSGEAGWTATGEDPLRKAQQYRNAIDALMSEPAGRGHFPMVRGVVVLPQWSEPAAQRLLSDGTKLNQYDADFLTVVGEEVFSDGAAFKQMTAGTTGRRKVPKEAIDRLLNRLRESEGVSDQRRPIVLSSAAKEIDTNDRSATIRRVRGPAGSGKSVGLACRAARLAGEGKQVLVLSFNITLAHYLQDLVRRRARELGADHRLVDCTHFHGFCSDVSMTLGSSESELFERARTVYASNEPGLPTYDAVLVDEGQDFEREWWNFLRKHVRRNEQSEMLLAADATQDIYGKRSWVNEVVMAGCGFNGPWSSLPGSYRMPADLIPIVAEFADAHLSTEVDPPAIPTDSSTEAAKPTQRRWVNTSSSDAAAIVADEVERILASDGAPPASDLVYLTNEHEIGLRIAEELAHRSLESEYIFAATKDEQRRAKSRFWPGDGRMKGCTVHSFKGWESRAVVILLQGGAERPADLAYVAMTRVRGKPVDRAAFVTVVNTFAEFDDFQPRFERPIGPAEVAALKGQIALDLNGPETP